MKRRSFCYASASAAAAAFLSVDRALAAMLEVTSDVDALTVAGNQATLTRSAVQELSDSLRGPLLLPGNPVYDSARHVLNAAIDKHPALIVQASGVADISSAVNFARENRLLVAVSRLPSDIYASAHRAVMPTWRP